MPNNDTWDSVEGKFFHSFDDEGYVKHQGQILRQSNDEIVVVAFFERLTGSRNGTKLVWLREIVDGSWALYETVEEMRDAYEHGLVKTRRE